MNRKEVVFVYNKIQHYRIEFFEQLSRTYNITVIHSGVQGQVRHGNLREVIVQERKLGPFFYQSNVYSTLRSIEFDAVVILFDLRYLSSIRIILSSFQRSSIVLWGAWLTKNELANQLRLLFSSFVGANVFYSQKSRVDFINRGLDERKSFVANNTFHVKVENYTPGVLDYLLFVGSMDARKDNKSLILSFGRILKDIPDNITLVFVGDGFELEMLKQLVENMKLNERIRFAGRVENRHTLRDFYNRSRVSISLGQAGLSVLQSLGHSVPFVTTKDAISGGEKYNIRNGYNGFVLDNKKEALDKVLVKICNEDKLVSTMRSNAHHYYSKYCTMANMCQGFIDAIEKTRNAQIDCDAKF